MKRYPRFPSFARFRAFEVTRSVCLPVCHQSSGSSTVGVVRSRARPRGFCVALLVMTVDAHSQPLEFWRFVCFVCLLPLCCESRITMNGLLVALLALGLGQKANRKIGLVVVRRLVAHMAHMHAGPRHYYSPIYLSVCPVCIVALLYDCLTLPICRYACAAFFAAWQPCISTSCRVVLSPPLHRLLRAGVASCALLGLLVMIGWEGLHGWLGDLLYCRDMGG